MRALLMRAQGAPVSEQLPLLERAVAGNPSDSQALNWLAQAYEGAGRPEDELRTFQRAYQVDPLAPVILQNYALASQTRGHREVAQRLVSELEVLLPNSARLYSTRGQMALVEGDLLNRIRWAAAAVKTRSAQRHGAVRALLRVLRSGRYRVLPTARGRRARDRSRQYARHDVARLLLPSGQRRRRCRRVVEERTGTSARGPGNARRDSSLHEAKGDYARALEAVLQLNPSYRSARPEFEWDLTFYTGPQAAYLLRETGDVAQARVVETAFMKWLDARWKPLSGPERGSIPRGTRCHGRGHERSRATDRASQFTLRDGWCDLLLVPADQGVHVLPAGPGSCTTAS